MTKRCGSGSSAQVQVIVVIAAHLARGFREAGHVEPGNARGRGGQESRLDAARHLELVLEPVALLFKLSRVLKSRGHLVETTGGIPQVVVARDGDPVGEPAGAERGGAVAERADSLGDAEIGS